MADDLTIKVQAQVAGAIKSLAEVQASLGSMTKEAVASNTKSAASTVNFRAALNDVAKSAGAFKAGVADVHAAVGAVTGKIHDFAASIAQLARGFLVGVGAMSPFIGLLTVAGAGLALSHIVKTTMDFDSAVYQLSLTLNGDVRAASIWIGVGEELGVTAQQVETGMRFLSQTVEKNSVVLRTMGIATVDARGKLLPMLDILTQARAYFQAHATATDNAAKAQQLFGRGGQALLPIMMLDQQTFADVTHELEQLGLVMSKDSLQAAQTYEFEVKHMDTAIKGLTVSIGHALLPGLAALANALSTWVTANIERVTKALEYFVGFILGFLNATFGLKISLDSTAAALAKVANAYQDTGDAAGTSADQTKGLTNAQRGLQEQTNDTVNALQAQVTVIDRQIKDLEELNRQESQQDQMIRLTEERAKKQKDIAKLRSDYGQALLIGDLQAAQDINAQLTDASQSEADTERQIKQQADQYDRQTRINTLNDHKTKLQDQINAVRQAAQDHIAAMQAAGAGMDRAMGSASENIQQTVKTMADQLKAIMDSAGVKAGQNFGDAAKTWLTKKAKEWAQDPTILGAAKIFGEAVGEFFMSGFMSGIGNWKDKNLANPIADAIQRAITKGSPGVPGGPGGLGAMLGLLFPSGKGHATGWTVPGPVGSPHVALLHGQEVVSAANSQQGRNRSGNVTIGPFNIEGATEPQATADAIGRVVRRELAKAFGTA